MSEAAAAARDRGIFVVSSSLQATHGFAFQGLGREPDADPNEALSYGPGSWWAASFYSGRPNRWRNLMPDGLLMVPMDSRTFASHERTDGYTFSRDGGWSWSVPYLAGLYALAAQVDPAITAERFWSEALRTGTSMRTHVNGHPVPFGRVIAPAALIDALRALQ